MREISFIVSGALTGFIVADGHVIFWKAVGISFLRKVFCGLARQKLDVNQSAYDFEKYFGCAFGRKITICDSQISKVNFPFNFKLSTAFLDLILLKSSVNVSVTFLISKL